MFPVSYSISCVEMYSLFRKKITPVPFSLTHSEYTFPQSLTSCTWRNTELILIKYPYIMATVYFLVFNVP